MFKVYDLKNKKKVVCTGTQRECAEIIECHYTYISKAAANNLKIHNRYLVKKVK